MLLPERWIAACVPRPTDTATHASVRRLGRILIAVFEAVFDGHLLDRAASLAYTTLLSLVPLLAVSFSVLQAFGAKDVLEPLLRDALTPLGGQAALVGDRILEFVGKMQVGVLGSLGIAMLLYTVITTVHKIELALNAIWDVAEPRRPMRRIADYLSVTFAGPVLAFGAIGLTDTVRGAFAGLAGRGYLTLADLGGALLALVPHALGMAAFALLYGLLPNTRVRPGAAIAGSLFAVTVWSLAGRLFASLLSDSNNYSAIYSGFAGAVLFILWLNVNWMIVLLGATVSCAWQAPGALNAGKPDGHAAREALALALMRELGRIHREGLPPPIADELAERLCARQRAIRDLLERLREDCLIIESDACGWLPARDNAHLEVRAILASVRGPLPAEAAGATLLAPGERALTDCYTGCTLDRLIDLPDDAAPPAPGIESRPAARPNVRPRLGKA